MNGWGMILVEAFLAALGIWVIIYLAKKGNETW